MPSMSSSCFIHRLLTRVLSLPGIDLVLKGAGPLLLLRVAGLFIAYLANVLVIRWLGAEQAGIFIYCVSVVLCAAMASNMGFARASMRFVAQYRATGQRALLAGMIRTSRGVTLAVSIGLATVGIVLVWVGHLDVAWRTPLILSFVAVPISSLVILNTEIAIGFGWTTFAYLPDQLLRHVAIILGVGAYAVLASAPDAEDAMTVVLVSSAAILGYQFVEFRRRERARTRVLPQRDMRLWLKTSLPLWLVALSDILMERVDILMLGYLASPGDIAVFNAASRTACLVLLMEYAIIARATSTVAALYACDRILELQRFIGSVLFWTIWPTLLIAAALAVAGPTVLSFFGPAFTRGETAFYVLLVAHVISIYFGPSVTLLSMTGHQMAAMMTFGATVALAALMNAILIPTYGIEGAAAATGCSVVIRSIVLAALTRRLTGITPVRLFPRLGLPAAI